MENVLTIEILKKLKKEDLINIILKLQSSLKPEPQETKILSRQEELDQKLRQYYENNKPEARPRPNYNFICVECKESFYDDISIFRQGINDPRCKKCSSQRK